MSDLRERGSPTLPQGSGTASPPDIVDELRREIMRRRARQLFEAHPPPVMIEHFELIRHIDEGGMGAVFEGVDTKLERPVALKVCLGGDSLMLRHEAQCLAKLAHPNVVAVYDVLDWRGHVVLIMELVQGITLYAWQCETSPGWRSLIDRYLDAGRGLAAAHAAGLEHGDFKPNNVLIDVTGRVRVADFGLARPVADVVHEGTFVVPNMGTKVYMPAERLQGRSAGERSDIYSFCASVWESLYCTRPFPGKNTHALLDAMMSGPPTPGVALHGTPRAVRSVLAKGLSREPSDRQPDMKTVLAELRHASETPERRRGLLRRALGLALVGALLGGTAIGTAAWVRRLASESNDPIPHSQSEQDPIAQTLALAREAASRERYDVALQHLESARLDARSSEAHLRRVAALAEELGDELVEHDRVLAWQFWDLAGDILILDIGDQDEGQRLRLTKTRNK